MELIILVLNSLIDVYINIIGKIIHITNVIYGFNINNTKKNLFANE